MATSETEPDGEEESTAPYDTKAIRFHLEERGQYFYVLLTRFTGRETILEDIGYGGEYLLFQTMSMNENLRFGSTDLFALKRKHPWDLGEMYPFDLLYALDQERVPWDAISDGDYLTADDVDALLEAHDGE